MSKNIYNFDDNKGHRADNISKSYIPLEKDDIAPTKSEEIAKSEEDTLEKGGKKAVIGEKREFGGRMYVKTATGWKFFGKGTGTKAQEHHESSKGDLQDSSDKALKEYEAKIKEYTAAQKAFPTDPTAIKNALNAMNTAKENYDNKVGKLTSHIVDKKTEKDNSKALDYIDRAGKALAEKATPDQISTLRDFAKKHGAEAGMSNEEIDKAITAAREKHTPKVDVPGVGSKTVKEHFDAINEGLAKKKAAKKGPKVSEIHSGAPADHLPKGEWTIKNDFKVSPGGGWSMGFKKGDKLKSDGNGRLLVSSDNGKTWATKRPPIEGTQGLDFNRYANHPERRDMWNSFARNIE